MSDSVRRAALVGSAWAMWLAAAMHAAGQAAPASPRAAHAGVAFETSDNCLACHNGLIAPGGEDVSIGIAWRASMMANSSRDPYWQASVRRETIDHPTHRAAIEGECAVCHMPMAHAMAQAAGGSVDALRLMPSGTPRVPGQQLAAEGVSCTLCHQIGPDRLGTPESFNGGFAIAPPPPGGRQMLGPFDVDAGLGALMRSATGVDPARAEHLRQSELCATCHTLYSQAFDARGVVVGSLPEQVPYLEWRHSAFAETRSCQSCHMPEVADTPIASVLGEPRERLARHTFLGGNFFMLRMLNKHRADLGVVAPSQELEAAAQATIRQLEAQTATLDIRRLELRGDRLDVDVAVGNLTGHKLPTGYPSRRAWLHLTVRNAAGLTIFESGAATPSGAIQGNDNDADATRVEPHYAEISRADQVQIYESVMVDPAGVPTTGLLRATAYIKDNRLLPRGFDKRTAPADIAVHGEAQPDADFIDGSDAVRYRIPVDAAEAGGRLSVDVELRYQPIGYRWADNLRAYDAAEPRRFVGYYDGMAAASSATLARARGVVPGT